MSGGPQVFLGATTFCSRCRQISGRREACPPARRPRGELRSARRLEARPGPAGLAAASNRAALGMAWPGLAAASNRAALLMAPRVFRAPEGPAVREARRPHFVQRRASKPARALRSLRRPPHQWGLVCGWVRRLGVRPDPAGLASAFTHVAAELPQCRMQFPHDSFGP